MTVWGVITLLWIVLDQATKVLAVEQLEAMNRQVNLGFMLLRPLRNLNGAFGFPAFPGLFVIVAAVVLVFVIKALPSTERVSLAVAYGLICGGALGNVADRIFRAPGFPNGGVVDFFDLRWWPVFNIADIGIVVGAFLIVILMIRAEREDRAAAGARERSASVRPGTGTPQG